MNNKDKQNTQNGTNTGKQIQRKAAKRPKWSLSRAGTLKTKLSFNYLREDRVGVVYDKTSLTLSTMH